MKSKSKFYLGAALGLVLVFSSLMSQNSYASVDDSCGFGQIQDTDPDTGDTTCTPATWYFESSSDGFSTNTYAQMDADSYDIISGVDTYFHLQVVCNARKLKVFVFSAPLDMYPTTNLSGYGTAQVKFDSGSISSLPYQRTSNFNGFSVTNPQAFTQKLINSKTKVSIKFGTINGTEVMDFPTADIASYASKFSSKGCSLGKIAAPAKAAPSKKAPAKWYPTGYYTVNSFPGFAFKDLGANYNCLNQDSSVIDCTDEWVVSQKSCTDVQLTWGWYSDKAETNQIASVVTDESLVALRPALLEGALTDPSVDITNAYSSLDKVACVSN